MVTMGNYLMSQQRYEAAIKMFTDATEGELDFDSASEALFSMGNIHLLLQNKNAAMASFQRYALECGNPKAFYYFATTENDGTDDQIAYYSQAAQSGILEACHKLGVVELAKIEKRAGKPRTILDYGMAREWFQLAATDEFVPSMLNIAIICKAVGETQTGLAWLKNAETWMKHSNKSPEKQAQAQTIRKHWDYLRVQITAVDSGYCRKISTLRNLWWALKFSLQNLPWDISLPVFQGWQRAY